MIQLNCNELVQLLGLVLSLLKKEVMLLAIYKTMVGMFCFGCHRSQDHRHPNADEMLRRKIQTDTCRTHRSVPSVSCLIFLSRIRLERRRTTRSNYSPGSTSRLLLDWQLAANVRVTDR